MNNGRLGLSGAEGMVWGVLHEGSDVCTKSEGLFAIYYMWK